MFEMHRLVHVSTGIWVRQQGFMDEKLQHVATHLADVFPATGRGDYHGSWQQYLPHALAVLRLCNESPAENYPHRLAYLAAVCLGNDWRLEEAIRLLKRVVAVQEEILAKDNWSREALANEYHKNGQSQEAMDILEPLVSMLERSQQESKAICLAPSIR